MPKKGTKKNGGTKNNDAVMTFVEKELNKNPEIETAELQNKAKSVDASVGKLSLRQFNARYPLQVKRKLAPKNSGSRRRRGSGRRGRAAAQANREALREVFLGFATELASATDEPKELVRVLAGVDRYVDDALKAARK